MAMRTVVGIEVGHVDKKLDELEAVRVKMIQLRRAGLQCRVAGSAPPHR